MFSAIINSIEFPVLVSDSETLPLEKGWALGKGMGTLSRRKVINAMASIGKKTLVDYVKVFDAKGVERLTTQLYCKGDSHIPADPFVLDSLILDCKGQIGQTIQINDADLVLA